MLGRPVVAALLEMKRADADERAVAGDERGAAPVGMGGAGEDRLVEEIFPIAGEFLLGRDPRRHRALPAAAAGDDHALADPDPRRAAERQRRQVEPAQRLDQAEAGLLVIGQRMARDGAAVIGVDPDRLGLGDEIADGEDQPVVADRRRRCRRARCRACRR